MRRKWRAPIFLSSHALKRWRERVGNESVRVIQNKIRIAIHVATKKGMKVNKYGASKINVESDTGIRAIVYPSIQGGWDVVTVTARRRRRMEHVQA